MIPCRRVLGNLIVAQLVKKFSLIGHEGLLLRLQQTVTGHCPEPDKSSQLSHNMLL
jgi:hypothetical protein